MVRIRKMPPARHPQDRARHVRRSQLHCASAGAAKAPYPLPPSSFPSCDRRAGSQFGETGSTSGFGASFFFLYKEKEKNGGAKRGQPLAAPTASILVQRKIDGLNPHSRGKPRQLPLMQSRGACPLRREEERRTTDGRPCNQCDEKKNPPRTAGEEKVLFSVCRSVKSGQPRNHCVQ